MKTKYRVETEQISTPGVIDAKESNAIMFVNKGTATAEIDGFPITFNEFISHGGNEGEINVSRYRITWTTPGTALVIVQRKYFVNS